LSVIVAAVVPSVIAKSSDVFREPSAIWKRPLAILNRYTPRINDTTDAKPIAVDGMYVRRETGVRISPTTKQAMSAPPATPDPQHRECGPPERSPADIQARLIQASPWNSESVTSSLVHEPSHPDRLSRHIGFNHFLWIDDAIEFGLGNEPQFQCSCLQGQIVIHGVVSDL
jgi:hypothetical protein